MQRTLHDERSIARDAERASKSAWRWKKCLARADSRFERSCARNSAGSGPGDKRGCHCHCQSGAYQCRLAENDFKPCQHKMWCVPKVDSVYVARMEDVLDLYAQPPDPKRPLICFDESPTPLIGHAREARLGAPGILARIDYEHVRKGTANLFVHYDVRART
jgi:hypothetical protein